MELPTKFLIGAAGLITVATLAATDPTILILLSLLGVLGIILALLAGRTETEAALTTGMDVLRYGMRLLTHAA